MSVDSSCKSTIQRAWICTGIGTNRMQNGQRRAWWNLIFACCRLILVQSWMVRAFWVTFNVFRSFLVWSKVYFKYTPPSGPRLGCKLSAISDLRYLQSLVRTEFGSKVCKIWPSMIYRSYKVTYSFLAVCTHEVPLYLCSIFSSCSLVQLSTASYRLRSGTRPKTYPCTEVYGAAQLG